MSILNSTTGLAFFGTPHESGNSTQNTLGAAASRVAEILHLQSSKAIIETLKSGLLFADLISEHWKHQLGNYNIISFWEGQGDIVPKASAIFGLPGRRERVIMLNTKHIDLCHFDDSQQDRDNLHLVLGNINWLYEEALKKGESAAVKVLSADYGHSPYCANAVLPFNILFEPSDPIASPIPQSKLRR